MPARAHTSFPPSLSKGYSLSLSALSQPPRIFRAHRRLKSSQSNRCKHKGHPSMPPVVCVYESTIPSHHLLTPRAAASCGDSKFMRGSAGFWCLRMQALQERAVGIKGGKRERAWATAPRAPSRKLPANSGFREVKPNRTWARPTELGHVPHLSIGSRCVYQ
jgi:hypothetical protein